MNLIVKILVLISLILLPFDSIPKVLPSTYRPISIYPLTLGMPLVLLMIVIKSKTIKKENLILIIFYIYSLAFSVIFSHYFYKKYDGFIDFFITLTIGIVVYLVYDYFFSIKRIEFNTNTEYINWIFKLIANIYIPVLIYGVYEILVMFGLLPGHIKTFVITYLTDRGTNRINLVSGETSWATFHLIFIIPIYYYLKKSYRRYKYFFYIAILLLIISFSLQGYIIFIFAMLINMLYQNKTSQIIKNSTYAILLIVIVISLFPLFADMFGEVYFINRFNNLGNLTRISDFFYLDESVFVRTTYPLIGLIIFKDNFIFGVGGGNYRYELGSYLANYFPKGLNYSSVIINISSEVSNPFAMFSRISSETGLIGLGLYSWFVGNIFLKIKKCDSYLAKYLGMFLIFSLCLYLQFDSFSFILPWLALAIINNLKES